MTEIDRIAKIVLGVPSHPAMPGDIDSLRYRVRELERQVDRYRRDANARAFLEALLRQLEGVDGAEPGAQVTGDPALSISSTTRVSSLHEQFLCFRCQQVIYPWQEYHEDGETRWHIACLGRTPPPERTA